MRPLRAPRADLQARGDFGMVQAFQVRQQKGAAHGDGQAVEHGVDAVQGLQDIELLFGRHGRQFRHVGQGVQPGLFQR